VTTGEAGVSTRALRPVLGGLQLQGIDVVAVLTSVGVDPATIADPEARVPHRLAIALWRDAVRLTADDAFGLHIAEALDFDVFDVQGYAFTSSPNLGEGLRRIERYQRLNHDAARVSVTREGDHAVVRHRLPAGHALPREVAEFVIAALVRAARTTTATALPIVEIRFAHAQPADVSEHERILAAPLRFAAGENAIVLRAEALELPHVKADPGLLAVLDRHAADLLSRLPEVHGLVDRVRAQLARQLRGGDPSVDRIATDLHMSSRTLSRKLAELGTSYKEILDAMRHDLALSYLADASLAIGEVGFLLGFSEPSAFYRAFRRWTGTTPAEHPIRRSGQKSVDTVSVK
jgi:AraC-like DNA-binding protein